MNLLNARTFQSLEHLNDCTRRWRAEVADAQRVAVFMEGHGLDVDRGQRRVDRHAGIRVSQVRSAGHIGADLVAELEAVGERLLRTVDAHADTIEFMRKLDVKEIHGYNAGAGLELLKPEVLGVKKGNKKGK